MVQVTEPAHTELRRLLAEHSARPQQGIRLRLNEAGELRMTIDVPHPGIRSYGAITCPYSSSTRSLPLPWRCACWIFGRRITRARVGGSRLVGATSPARSKSHLNTSASHV